MKQKKIQNAPTLRNRENIIGRLDGEGDGWEKKGGEGRGEARDR